MYRKTSLKYLAMISTPPPQSIRLTKFPVIHPISNNKTLPVYPHLTSPHIIELKDHYGRTGQQQQQKVKK